MSHFPGNFFSYNIFHHKDFLLYPILFSFFFLGQHLWHMEIPRLGVATALAIATATILNPSWMCHLHHSSWKHQILNSLSKARNWTLIFMDTSQICFHCSKLGIPILFLTCWSVLFSVFFCYKNTAMSIPLIISTYMNFLNINV